MTPNMCQEIIMVNGKQELGSFFKDVALSGTKAMPKKKLFWLLECSKIRPGAWKKLLDH
jgi:hypothetical protein